MTEAKFAVWVNRDGAVFPVGFNTADQARTFLTSLEDLDDTREATAAEIKAAEQ